ncbi:MAG: universal stress protein [Gemmatimonadota bacterium]
MISRILVALDGSALAESALPHAAAIARAFRSQVTLLRVLEAERRGGGAVDSAGWRMRKTEAVAYFQQLLARLHEEGFTAEAEIAEGMSPAEEIVGRARQRRIDLLVLGSYGRSGPNEFGVGGTAAKVLARAGLSLLVVRGPVRLAEGGSTELLYERILVPVDTSQRCDWALSQAATLARAGGSELVLAHVVQPPWLSQRKPASARETRLVDKVVELNRAAAEEYLREVEGRFGGADLRIRSELLVSPQPARAVHELAERERVSLVVLSAHGASGSGPWPYGSVAATLLSYGTTPLLILQDMPQHGRADAEPLLGSSAQSGNGWSR